MSLPACFEPTEQRFCLSGMPEIELEVEAIIKRVYRNSLATSQRYTEENGSYSLAVMDLIGEIDPFPVETPISKKCFEAAVNGYKTIKPVASCNIISKTRFFIPEWDNLRIEQYEGSLGGLVILSFFVNPEHEKYSIRLLPVWAVNIGIVDIATNNPKYDERLMSYKGKPSPTLLDCIE